MDYGMKYHQTHGIGDGGDAWELSSFGVPLFGFELEMETRRSTRELTARFVTGSWFREPDVLSCHNDGGLNGGFEVVSKPATLGYLLNKMDWSFLRRAKRAGVTIGEEIGERGFHVHISRTSFDDEAHVERFARTIISQVKQPDIDKLGWFVENNYCRAEYDANERRYRGKYYSVNCAMDRTVEVRCLMPTFSESRIKEYLRYLNETINNTQGEQS
jgi:hypothetical protein